ncbi:Lrp/AsnC family transcriptional regulator [Amycolatopsis sp.]|jgi:predicted transcriptional regulator|uniref:Lrp/AsnC family transcriptional regulator n=1 Tax=Amycolatopsis sp. TaxID=37632 RepID=UPI002E0480D3|nr:AsnC family transcriptional regulator [Amycolatopsis sp.]
MDELDSAIVRELQEDARQSNRDIARKVGVAPSTCLERTRLLRQRGVIRGYHADIDLAALNRGVQALVDQLHSFLVDELSKRREIISFRSSIIFRHIRKTNPEPLFVTNTGKTPEKKA